MRCRLVFAQCSPFVMIIRHCSMSVPALLLLLLLLLGIARGACLLHVFGNLGSYTRHARPVRAC
jgi:hypothetical protein